MQCPTCGVQGGEDARYCANCGTPLFFHHLENGRTNLMIGSLDDPNAFPPLANTCTENMVTFSLAPGTSK